MIPSYVYGHSISIYSAIEYDYVFLRYGSLRYAHSICPYCTGMPLSQGEAVISIQSNVSTVKVFSICFLLTTNKQKLVVV